MYDANRLLKLLNGIVDRSNTVIVVEHNIDIIKQADYIIDMGPGAGKLGGKVVAAGTPDEVRASEESYTARYL
jgi:excinuclease ABC subunit A